ncbi:hypothetical protein TNIN_95961 [Trichonephila inaurata madagascariensis]|uniref:Uncharacterized protein n=1 Tax=Trichonephila inaurata madagascariensis TaxID=2747483 RepID=A0A8X6XW25_9ARAC|nr:hypothetical protein TNIN_95961 [Trichonephila inaurata madagascariensis]
MLDTGDHQQRIEFANKYSLQYDSKNDWHLRISWTKEAHFTIIGAIHSKNCVHWADTNPNVMASMPLYVAKFTVLRHCRHNCVSGPYFFEKTTLKGFKHDL